MKIMFVCTGNTCRSAMAHHMLEKMVEDKKDIEVYSCGIYADSGEPSTYNAIEIMKEYGIEKLAKEMAVRGGVTRITATVHVYRKTFASVLYRKTGDVLLVSKLLGHAKPDMTVQYYLIDDIEEMQHKYNRVA